MRHVEDGKITHVRDSSVLVEVGVECGHGAIGERDLDVR